MTMRDMPEGFAERLEGRLVLLERLEPARHYDGLWRIGQDPELWRYAADRVTTAADLHRYMEEAKSEFERGQAFPYVIRAANGGTVLGSTRYLAMVWRHRRLEIGGTWLGCAFQQKGYNVETKLLLLAQAFRLGFNRVEFKTDSLNAASRAALRKLGATEEGTFRNHMVMPDGRLRHSVYYSITKEDWPDLEPRLRERLDAQVLSPAPAHLPFPELD
jgi:RimJ/RimL family protein N-acetyltransferase